MRDFLIAASILSADFARLGEEARAGWGGRRGLLADVTPARDAAAVIADADNASGLHKQVGAR